MWSRVFLKEYHYGYFSFYCHKTKKGPLKAPIICPSEQAPRYTRIIHLVAARNRWHQCQFTTDSIAHGISIIDVLFATAPKSSFPSLPQVQSTHDLCRRSKSTARHPTGSSCALPPSDTSCSCGLHSSYNSFCRHSGRIQRAFLPSLSFPFMRSSGLAPNALIT